MSDDLRAVLRARPKNGERIWVEEDDFASGWGAAMDHVRAALATPEPAPDLDVERLARAIEVVALRDRDRVLVGDYTASTYVEHAANLAREYAALEAVAREYAKP